MVKLLWPIMHTMSCLGQTVRLKIKLYIIFRSKIQQLILESFKTEKPLYDQIEILLNNVHHKYFDLSCVPILSKSKKSYKVWL